MKMAALALRNKAAQVETPRNPGALVFLARMGEHLDLKKLGKLVLFI